MDLYTNANTLKLFSGDIMGPSIISDIQHGDQMIKIMQAFKFDFSVIGNHEFDFTEEHFLEWNDKVNQGMGTHRHIWLASNIKHKSGQKAGRNARSTVPAPSTARSCAFGLVDTYWIEGSKSTLMSSNMRISNSPPGAFQKASAEMKTANSSSPSPTWKQKPTKSC